MFRENKTEEEKSMITNKDWDTVATIYNTDLYGLLNILLKYSHYDEDDIIDTINTLKAVFCEHPQDEEH